MNMDRNIQEIPMEDIIPNRFQPRLAFNEEGINELAESIKQHGIIQPLVVRRLGDKFEIIAGERRYKAATMAGLTKVPVIISDIDDNKSAEVALVENIQRRNLTAIEEAKSYKNLLDRGYLTQEQLANKMGVSQSSIANKLRLLNLDEEVQDALLNEKISERHARALLTLENKEDQKKWLQKIIAERMTVRQLDMELKKLQENGGEEDTGIPLVDINPNIEEIVNNAEDINVIREPHDVASMLLPEGSVKEKPKAPEEVPAPPKMPNKFFNFLEDEQANMNVIEPDEIFNMFNQEVAPIETPEQPNGVILEPTEQLVTSIEEPKTNLEEPTISPVELLDDLEMAGTSSVETTNVETTINPFAGLNELTIENPEPTNNPTEEQKEIEEHPVLPKIVPEIEPITETPIEEISNETFVMPENIVSANLEQPLVNSVPEPVSEVTKQEELAPVISEQTTDLNTPTEPVIEQPIQSTEQNNQIMENNETNTIIENEPVINNETMHPFKSIFFNTEEEEPTPVVEEAPIINNTIEEVKPVIEEPLVDPLDSIVTLEPGYEERQKELAGTDLKTAINVVRDTVKDLENRGFLVEIEEADLEDIYHITIKIDKNN